MNNHEKQNHKQNRKQTMHEQRTTTLRTFVKDGKPKVFLHSLLLLLHELLKSTHVEHPYRFPLLFGFVHPFLIGGSSSL